MTKEDFLELLYKKYDNLVRWYCWKILKNYDDAGEARAEAWIKFIKAAKGLRHFYNDGYPLFFTGDKLSETPEKNGETQIPLTDIESTLNKSKRDEVKKYLVQIVKNESIDMYSRKKINNKEKNLDNSPEPIDERKKDGCISILEWYPNLVFDPKLESKGKLKQTIKHIFNKETDRNREIVYLYFGEDLTFEEIGKKVGLGRRQVKNIIDKFIKEAKLKEKYYGDK
jgi:RNA polymerase sigma factor (sigma-70 family)